MIRKTFYISKNQDDTLKKFKDITVSEHIRRAIDDYIEKIEELYDDKTSMSPSIFKGISNIFKKEEHV